MPDREKPDLLLLKALQPDVMAALAVRFTLHRLDEARGREAFFTEIGPRIRCMAVAAHAPINGLLMDRLPKLEIVSSFGVGYDTIDAAEAGRRGIVVTNTPERRRERCASGPAQRLPRPGLAGAGR